MIEVGPEALAFYRRALDALLSAGAPFLVGGSYAFERYTGIARHSKDFDVFARKEDAERLLEVLETIGCRRETPFPHWLVKAYWNDDYVDIIYGGGSGVAMVDEQWFEHAVEGEVLGASVRLIPAEEMIWSKGFVMERERYDGADVLHLVRSQGRQLDWKRLLRRFGEDWRLLLGIVIHFGYVYPSEREAVPRWVLEELSGRLRRESAAPPPAERICRGTLISRAQYLHDVEALGFRDARLEPRVQMDRDDIAIWTAAIEEAKGEP